MRIQKKPRKKWKKFLRSLQHGHVIITTRVDSWSRQIKKKQLEVLSRDADEFFMETTMTKGKKTAMTRNWLPALRLTSATWHWL
jgi:hypothetical protein